MTDATNTFVQMLLEEAVRVLTPILIAAVIGAVGVGIQWLRAKVGDARWAQVEQAVQYAVFAAEQAGLTNELMRAGGAKKALALDLAQQFLKARGVNIDLERLSALIEAEVAQSLNWSRIIKSRDGEPIQGQMIEQRG